MKKLHFGQAPSSQTTLETLQDEHHTLESRLQRLDKQRWLSPEEQYEKMVIKKRKLALKDRISQWVP